MNIIQRPEIFALYHNGFPRIHPAKQIVMHGTGGGADSHALIDGWILTPKFERAQAYHNGEGFPFNIDRNGDIYQFCDPLTWWQFHSGTWLPGKQLQDQHDAYTIGIELMNPARENMGGYTDEQYQTLLELILSDLLPNNPEISEITGHGVLQQQFCGRGKSCPGPEFKWNLIASMLGTNQYQFELGDERIFNIARSS